MLISWSSFGQTCDYVTPRFQVESELEVFYGIDTNYLGQPDSLFLHIYKPINTDISRPLVLWCFGGGFVGGNKESFSDVCEEMASRGYVAVTIDYRLGYVQPDLLPEPFAVDDKELGRAGFRAMQDLKGAIRFMKGRHMIDGIDLEHVYVGGGSAGAITALAAAFIDKPDEKDLSVVGDIGSTNTFNPIARPDLGPIEGRLHLGVHDATVQGVVNIFGALAEITQIEEDDEEIIYSYHQTRDPIVPCGFDRAYHGFPFVPDNMPTGYGSCEIDSRLKDLGRMSNEFKTWIFDGNQHAIHDEEALFNEVFPFLNQHICGITVASEDQNLLDMVFYPNPVSDILQWTQPLSDQAFIYNDLGVMIGSIPKNSRNWDMSGYALGIYHIVMKGNRQTILKK